VESNAVGGGLLGQVVVHDLDLLALCMNLLSHGLTGEGRDVKQRRRVGGSGRTIMV
jgi:hypothetical protein